MNLTKNFSLQKNYSILNQNWKIEEATTILRKSLKVIHMLCIIIPRLWHEVNTWYRCYIDTLPSCFVQKVQKIINSKIFLAQLEIYWVILFLHYQYLTFTTPKLPILLFKTTYARHCCLISILSGSSLPFPMHKS